MSSLGLWAGPYQTFAQKQKLMFLGDHPVMFYARPLNSQLRKSCNEESQRYLVSRPTPECHRWRSGQTLSPTPLVPLPRLDLLQNFLLRQLVMFALPWFPVSEDGKT